MSYAKFAGNVSKKVSLIAAADNVRYNQFRNGHVTKTV